MIHRTDLKIGDRFWHLSAPNIWFTVRKRRLSTAEGEIGFYGIGELTNHAVLTYRELDAYWRLEHPPKPVTPSPMVTQS